MNEDTRICTLCKKKKLLDQFLVIKSGIRKGYRIAHCRKCDTILVYKWTKKNVEKNRAKALRYWRKINQI